LFPQAKRGQSAGVQDEPIPSHQHLTAAAACLQAGRWAQAETICRQVLAGNPSDADALHMLGYLAHRAGKSGQAIELIGRAIAAKPDQASFYSTLGVVLSADGRTEDAIAAYRRSLALAPQAALTHYNLANALKAAGRPVEAVDSYGRAIHLQPDFPEALNNLAQTWIDLGELGLAIDAANRALALRPDFSGALNTLGLAMLESGQARQAVELHRRALAQQPDPRIASNLLYAMHFDPACDSGALLREHQKWNDAYARSLPGASVHSNDRTSGRRLRIGYVSPNFRSHPVGRFLLPLLKHHDRRRFEVFCYSDVRQPDAITGRLRHACDVWREVANLSKESVADLVRADRIDILVDLTMHMAGSRLLAFALKPAPLQVTYLAYCSTTGLAAMDYRLSDPHLDPQGIIEPYTEQTILLPRSYWCYEPPDEAPPVAPLPAHAAGFVTFGCLNNFAKVNAGVWELWCELLKLVPNSRLILHAGRGPHRDAAHLFLRQRGIDSSRLEFVDGAPMAQYLSLYHRIDIALDPFPYAGGTTTCDALWMGVPLITLAGDRAVGRAGVSILTNAAMPQLVTQSKEQYLGIVAGLAHDLPALSEMRQSMRQRLIGSPLMDGFGFARDVEETFVKMWQSYCAAG
jgi:protein O-GlcNAc transferase